MRGDICALLLAVTACGEFRQRPVPEGPQMPGEPDEPHVATVRLRVGEHPLAAGEESVTCWSRTLHNDAPLYVEAVTFSNLGSFHHSNWFVVPEDVFAGEDGTWDCAERGFEELSAALSGGVLFAQSTQAWTESMGFTEGAVIKIPARAKIVADLHLLNLAPTERQTEAWLQLHLIHPYFVDIVLKPMMLAYYDLDIPAESESRFTAQCDVPADMNLYYALPHYHSTGNYFNLQLVDDIAEPIDLFTVNGFSADVVGQAFEIPLEFGSYASLRFTCGYDNWMNRNLRWGLGADEMCVMLGLIASNEIVTGTVLGGTKAVDAIDGVTTFEGDCQVLTSPAGEAYRLPRVSELAAPIYVPPVDPRDEGQTQPPTCVDADPTAEPAAAPTLDNLREYVFEPWCTFSACHGEAAAGTLDLHAEDLETELRGVNTLVPRVDPGNPEGSVLYQVVSRCEPDTLAGNHMPRNAPVLLDDALVAMVRAWIENLPPE